MPKLTAEVFKHNYTELYAEIFDKGFSAGRADAIAEAIIEKKNTQRKTGASGDMTAESAENKKILANL